MDPKDIEKMVKNSRKKGDFDKDWEAGKDIPDTQTSKDKADDTGADGS